MATFGLKMKMLPCALASYLKSAYAYFLGLGVSRWRWVLFSAVEQKIAELKLLAHFLLSLPFTLFFLLCLGPFFPSILFALPFWIFPLLLWSCLLIYFDMMEEAVIRLLNLEQLALVVLATGPFWHSLCVSPWVRLRYMLLHFPLC